MPDLVITNGDSAADLLVAAGHGGDVLSWRDVLHEGPIAIGPIEALTARRVAWLARRFQLDAEEIADDFAERDEIVRRHADYERIELWFEHDLFDQLQLIQILSFLADAKRCEGVALVQADEFLGAQRSDTILRFADRARPVTPADLDLAAAVWADLASPTPEAVAARAILPREAGEVAPRSGDGGGAILPRDAESDDGLILPRETGEGNHAEHGGGGARDDRLPFLRPALLRFLEELPSPVSGLSRTEAAALARLDAGTRTPAQLFAEVIGEEEAAFMGDWSFFHLLDELATCNAPLIAGLAPQVGAHDFAAHMRTAELELTPAGDDVLAGRADHVAVSGVDRWWGGTRLAGRDVWRYDREARLLHPPLGQGELGF